jgi:hypothetical protein
MRRRYHSRFCAAALSAGAVVVSLPSTSHGTLHWDADGSAAGNNTSTGAGLGGSGTWGAAVNWFNGTTEVAWSAGEDAVFTGTAGTVTLASPQAVDSLTFKANGYTLTGSALNMGPSPAGFAVDAGVIPARSC